MIPLSERPTQLLLEGATEPNLDSIPRPPRGKRIAALAGGGVVLAGLCWGAILARNPSTSATDSHGTEAQGGSEAGELRPPVVVQYPVREFTLEADRDVIIVPRNHRSFGPLNPQRTYVLSDTSAFKLGEPSVLSPSSSGTPTVFYLLSGEASRLPEQARLGVLSSDPRTFEGVRELAIFRLGPGSTEAMSERYLRLTGADGADPRSLVFHPDAEGLSLKRALVLKGLDPMLTYTLNLEATDQGAFLHGREAGPATTVACAQWMPPPEENPSLRTSPRDPDALILQFLLRQGEERRVRGVLGLMCGFVDDGADGNSGALLVRIDAEAPPRRPPPRKPRNTDATP